MKTKFNSDNIHAHKIAHKSNVCSFLCLWSLRHTKSLLSYNHNLITGMLSLPVYMMEDQLQQWHKI